MVSVRMPGMVEALGRIANVAAAGRAANGPILSVTSSLAYAFGIETGRHRGGRLARRAGGAYMMRNGLEAVRPLIAPTLGPALLQGPVQVGAAKGRLQQAAVREVRSRTTVLTGRLRDSVIASGRAA